MDGIASVQPQAAFKMFGFLEWDRCLAPMSGVEKELLNVAAIAMSLGCFLIIFMSALFWKKAVEKNEGNPNSSINRINAKIPAYFRDRSINQIKVAGVELLLLVLEPLFHGIVNVFNCSPASIDGKDVLLLDGNGDSICWEGAHLGAAIFAGIVGACLFIVIPVYIFRVIYQRDNDDTGLGYALTESYRKMYPYWIITVFYERMILVVVSVASESISKTVHLWTMFFVILLWYVQLI